MGPEFERSDGHLVCIIHSFSAFQSVILSLLFPLSTQAERRALGSGLIYYRWVIVY